jgi:hypothetical protein
LGLRYAGELIVALIERVGGSVEGEITTGCVPEGLEPVYVHRQTASGRSASRRRTSRAGTWPSTTYPPIQMAAGLAPHRLAQI